METYREVIQKSIPTLRDAGFSKAEIGCFLRDYGRDIRNGVSVYNIGRKVSESSNARIERRNKQGEGGRIGEREQGEISFSSCDPADIMILSGLLGCAVGITALIGGASIFGIPALTSLYGMVGGFEEV